jgi:sugar phosphate isomerase/epimerase
MHRLAFSTNAFKKNTLDEAVDAIAGIGYAGVELMADMHHAYPPRMDPARRRDLVKRIKDLGMRPSNLNAFTLFACGDTYHPTWIEHDGAKRQQRIDHTLACIDLAAELGIATISLQPGGPLIGMGIDAAEAGKRYADGLAKVAPAAKAAGIVLGIEPEPGLFIENSVEYLDFKNRYFASDDTIKMNCDIGHLFCVGEDPAAVIRSLPQHICHVHVEDIGANRVHQHLTPGKGVIDFADVFSALSEIGYTGWTTVELYPYETTAAGVAKLAFDHLTSDLKHEDTKTRRKPD